MFSQVARQSFKTRCNAASVRSISSKASPMEVNPASASSSASAGLKTAATLTNAEQAAKHISTRRGLTSANRSFHAPSSQAAPKRANMDTNAEEAARLRRNRDARALYQ